MRNESKQMLLAATTCCVTLILGGLAWLWATAPDWWLDRWALIPGDGGRETLMARLPHYCEAPLGEGAETPRVWELFSLARDRFGHDLAAWALARWREDRDGILLFRDIGVDGERGRLASWWEPAEGRTASVLFVPDPPIMVDSPGQLIELGIVADGEAFLTDDDLRLHQADAAKVGRFRAAFSDPCEGMVRGLAALAAGNGPGEPGQSPPASLVQGRPIAKAGAGG